MNSTLYNMTFGALGALVLLLSFNIMRSVGRLRPTTWLRNATRRVLGIQHFEELSLDELRIYRADVDRWNRDTQAQYRRNATEIASIRSDVATRMAADRTRNNRVRTEVEELGILLHSYVEALGPMWTTAAGHRMPMRLLSSGHLRNILEGGFAKGSSVTGFIRSELERRSIDAAWRANDAAAISNRRMSAAAKVKPDAGLTRLANEMFGPCISLDEARRVRVLPKWVQVIIRDLQTTSPQKIKRSERTRLKRMPIWAQQLISDLEQSL